MHIMYTYLKPTWYPNNISAFIPSWTLQASRHTPGLYASACVQSLPGTLKSSTLGQRGKMKNPIQRHQQNSRPQKRLCVSSFLIAGSPQVVTSSWYAPSLHGVVQTYELETENVPQRTMSNVYFLLSCYPNSFTDLDFSMLVDVLCIHHTWYWPWFSCNAGWGGWMYITHFTGDRPWTKSALLRYASTRDIDRSLSWNVKHIMYYEEYASS